VSVPTQQDPDDKMSENETKLPIIEDEIEIESLRNQLEVRTISISKKIFHINFMWNFNF
jgi:hypothetical protein